VGIITFSIYELFSVFVKNFDVELNKFDSFFLCVLLAVQLFGIKYFLNMMRENFGKIKFYPKDENLNYELMDKLRRNFTSSKLYYILLLLIIVPFVVIELKAIMFGYSPLFFQENPTSWALLLDVYNNFLNYFMLYLLANILWIAFNISWILDKFSNEFYIKSLRIDLFDADKIGGLLPIRKLIVWFSVYYSFVIILGVLSNLVPRGLLLYESVFLAVIWILGVIFSIWSGYTITRLINGKIGVKISTFNEIYDQKSQELVDLIAKGDDEQSEKKLNLLSTALESLDKERDRIFQYGIKPIDAKTIVILLTSTLISLLSILKTIGEIQNNEVIAVAMNLTHPVIGGSINYLHHFIP
jgi:hypothetical protein